MTRSAAPRALRRILLWVCAACVAAVGVALVAQHRFDMQPCPWCILQRLVFVLIALLAALGAFLPTLVARAVGGLIGLLAVAGAAAAIYQNRVAAKSASCNLSLAERILSPLKLDAWAPSVFEIRAACADAATTLLGLPFEIWSALLFASIALVCGVLLRHRRRR